MVGLGTPDGIDLLYQWVCIDLRGGRSCSSVVTASSCHSSKRTVTVRKVGHREMCRYEYNGETLICFLCSSRVTRMIVTS